MDTSAQTPNSLRRRISWRAALARRRRDARDTERRLRVMEVIGDISLAPLPLDALLQALLDGVRREMGLETVAILLPHDGGAEVRASVASGAGAEVAHTFRVPLGYGLVGEAMRSGRSIIIRDASEQLPHPEYLTPELLARMRLRSAILAPLIVADRPLGALAVVSSEPNHFTTRDVRLVELVSARVALAIERTRAHDEAARAHERLRFLNDAGVALNATLDYRETTQRLADILTPTLGAACAIYLLEEDGLLRKAATRSPAREHPDDPRAVALERMLARLPEVVEARPGDPDCAIGGSVHALTPVFERVALMEADDENDRTASVVSVPIVVRQHALGAFYLVARSSRDFTAGDMPMLQGLAERAAVAIDNARLYLETQEALATGRVIATQLDTIFNATDVGIFVTD
ncbi:MAG: GAF domain-containing protein, partial [Chloroflexota bacterium]|nr:GAF domain-containing protein [Chloroflexota bacterium]